jgi:hypothetical protein
MAAFSHDLGLVAFEQGLLTDAETRAQESLQIARTVSNLLLEANALALLSDIRLAEGGREGPILAHRALTMYREADGPDVVLTESLVRLSFVTVDEDAELACLLVGSRDAWVAQSGMAIEPFSVKQRDQVVEMAEMRLGVTKTAETLARGERLSVSQAVDLALERIEPRPT